MRNQLYEKKKRGKRGRHYENATASNKKEKNTKQSAVVIDRSTLPEIDYAMDGSVKQLFLNLTKMQIPFEFEKTIKEFLPDDIETDEHGNFFKQIGDSKVMFVCHLDTYAREYKKVWHVIDGDIIKTDGTTTLGGDDKAGAVVMIKMMEANIPGLYYFFRGEEGVLSPTGTWGSKQALKSKKEFFKKFEKCVAFDRRGISSIISSQMYGDCCSDEFVNALEKEFKNNGLEYKKDTTGMWCDSGVFMETIPECTNISVGYKSEHTFAEEQNIDHLEKLVKTVIKINWEGLPVKRDPSEVSSYVGRYKYDWGYEWEDFGRSRKSTYKSKNKSTQSRVRDYVSMDDMFFELVDLLSDFDYDCLNPDYFKETEEMYFMNYDTNDFIAIRIIDFDIYISEDETLKKFTNVGDLDDFQKYIVGGIDPVNIDELDDKTTNHLSAIMREIEPNQSTQKFMKYNYTEEQLETFTDIANNNLDLLEDVMNDMLNSNKLVVSNNLWMKIDSTMIDMGYHIDYSNDGSGINPDEFTEWISDNWIEMQDLISDKPKYIKTVKNIVENSFLSLVYDSDIDLSKYTNDQIIIFNKLVENEKILVKMILKDFEINNTAMVRPELEEKILDAIDTVNYKRTDKTPLKEYPQKFITWVYELRDEIEIYYNK